MASESYRRTQIGWPIVLIMVGVLGIVGTLTLGVGAGPAFALVVFVTVAVVANLAWLTVTVDETHVRLTFGVGLVRKRFALSDIRSCQLARTEWYYGTGIKMIDGGWLYSVWGRMAVQLDLPNNTRVLVGSDEPERLLAAIQAAAGVGAPTGSSDSAAGPSAKWLAIILVPVFVTLAVMFYMDMRPPRITVGADTLTVRSGFYRSETRLREITEVIVSDTLPSVRRRTNGFAFGGALRGHFRVDSLGAGMLFLDRGHPPYVIVRTATSYVIIGYKDYEHTRKLIEVLAKASAP